MKSKFRKMLLMFLSFVTITSFGMVNIFAADDFEYVEFDLSNAKIGDIYTIYDDNNDYTSVEIVNYIPMATPTVLSDVGTSNWSGTMPNGTWNLFITKNVAVTTASFYMTVSSYGSTCKIQRTYGESVDSVFNDVDIRHCKTITPNATSSLTAMSELSWTMKQTVNGSTIGTFTCYLRGEVSGIGAYRVAWKI